MNAGRGTETVVEAPWVRWRFALFDSRQRIAVGLDSIERVLELHGWDVPEVAVETLGVVPVHPPEGRELGVLDRLPRAGAGGSADEFGRVIAVDGLGESIVIAVADGSDRRGGADLGQSFAVANRCELRSRVAVTAQILMVATA